MSKQSTSKDTPKSETPKDDSSSQGLPGAGRTTEFDYVLEWIKEANDARRAQNAYVERAINAYQGKPSRNRYTQTINGYIADMQRRDSEMAKQMQVSLKDLPEKSSMVVNHAVETLVAMAQGGVGQYEFGPYDPDGKMDSELADRLASCAKFFYRTNHMDSLIPQDIKMAALAGVGTLLLKQEKGKKKVTLLETSQMWVDPKRFKTNCSRFIGFSQRESFRSVKDRTYKSKAGYKLKTINEAEVYVSQIQNELNSVLQNNPTQGYLHDELRKDIDIFYQPIITRIKNERETDKDNPDKMYDGDEIECSYIYDLMNDMYFEIVNRRYIIVAKQNDLKRSVPCKYLVEDGESETGYKVVTKNKEVKLDHPFVELPFTENYWDTYAVSPLFYLLDDYDDLCAMESVLYHNLSIMAPLTFQGQASDGEKVANIASIAGEIVESLPQTFGTLSKSHDISPVIAGIQRIEEKIKRTMKAVDPFELQAMLGDRATAKEVVSASGQVAQGINQFLANIETMAATLGEKFIKMEIIYGDDDLSFTHNGEYSELTRQEMAQDFEVGARLVTSIKLEQEANSQKALNLVQYMGTVEGLNKKKFFGTMIPITLQGLVSKQQAEDMVDPAYRPLPDEIYAAMRKKAQIEARMHPVDKMDLSGMDEAEMDRAIEVLSSGGDLHDALGGPTPPQPTPNSSGEVYTDPSGQPTGDLQPAPVDTSGQEASVLAATGQNQPAPAPGGLPPEQAGITANDQSGQGYIP